jgi:hypothetical protein
MRYAPSRCYGFRFDRGSSSERSQYESVSSSQRPKRNRKDDIGFASSLRKVLLAAGRSGNLDLIDPNMLEVTAIRGFFS